MENHQWVDIFRLFPKHNFTTEERRAKFEEFKELFFDSGREYCTTDEIEFLLCLDHTIDVLKKAKTMLHRGRFTVLHHGPRTSEVPTGGLDEFEILPIKQG